MKIKTLAFDLSLYFKLLEHGYQLQKPAAIMKYAHEYWVC